jgi:ketosteroid isomerase-like protein
MSAVDDVDELVDQYHLALAEFLKGNPEPVWKLHSCRDDVALANPYGPPVRGFDEVAKAEEHAASLRRDGETIGFEIVAKYVTAELAYVVQIERAEAKIGGGEEITPYAVRSTMIFRPEGGCVEGHASARRPHNHRSASGIGDTGVDLPLERTS